MTTDNSAVEKFRCLSAGGLKSIYFNILDLSSNQIVSVFDMLIDIDERIAWKQDGHIFCIIKCPLPKITFCHIFLWPIYTKCICFSLLYICFQCDEVCL